MVFKIQEGIYDWGFEGKDGEEAIWA